MRLAVAVRNRAKWARAILQAGIVDTAYVSAQRGRRTSTLVATALYVLRGFRQGLRLNPLFVDVVVGDALPGAHRVPALYAYLATDPRGVQISPLWDAAAYLAAHPERADEPGGALGAVWRRRHKEGVPGLVEGSWEDASQRAIHAAGRASAGHVDDLMATTTAGSRELIVALGPNEVDIDETLSELLELAERGWDLAIGYSGADAETWAQLSLLGMRVRRIRGVLRPGEDTGALLSDLRGSSGAEVLLIRGPYLALSAAQMIALADEAVARSALVAPVWLDLDGTIASVGADASGRILAGYPREDVHTLTDAAVFTPPLLAGNVVAGPAGLIPRRLRGRDVAAWAQLDSPEAHGLVSVDVVARARVSAPAPELPHVDISAARLLKNRGWQPSPHAQAPWQRQSPVSTLQDGRSVPRLRWAIRTAAPAGPRGEWWGDTHFARALAGALRRLGQDVVVDAYPARYRPSAVIDDVTLVLRGPEPIEPGPAGLSALWVISHPNELTAAEASGFDLIFAASDLWARRVAAEWKRPIETLLQCTDPARFHPSSLPRTRDVVFVGTARGIPRPSVLAPVSAGVPVAVYGPDWREWIPADRIAGIEVPNDELPALYETAAAVLNDHWPAMQREGFIANRPYDVVAAGGRVISDDVKDLAAHFDGAVVTYRDTEELITMLTGDLDALFPGPSELARIAARIRELDSFDARARVLLDRVLDSR